MRLLLDTQAFLWWITDDERLSPRARRLIADRRHDVFFSAASAWEISVKMALGRLMLPDPPERFLPRQIEINGFLPWPARVDHAVRVYALPPHHRDPFDRMLVAQALVDGLHIVTANPQIGRYRAPVVW